MKLSLLSAKSFDTTRVLSWCGGLICCVGMCAVFLHFWVPAETSSTENAVSEAVQ